MEAEKTAILEDSEFLLYRQVFGESGCTKIPVSTGYYMIAKGTFPAPIKLTPRLSAFVASEVREWMASRIAERDRERRARSRRRRAKAVAA